MKAIILTYAPVNDKDKTILEQTKIYKIALNQHGAEYKPDARIITDYVLPKIYQKYPEKIISIRDRSKISSERVEYYDGEFKGATIVAALDYLCSKGYDEILIIGDNSVNDIEFQTLVNTEIDKLSKILKIYQYTKGNFNIPIISIREFCI